MTFYTHTGLIFPNGSIPADFTIFARAKFLKSAKSGVNLRAAQIVRGSQKLPSWYVGWNVWLGVAKYDDKAFYTNAGRITDDSRHVNISR